MAPGAGFLIHPWPIRSYCLSAAYACAVPADFPSTQLLVPSTRHPFVSTRRRRDGRRHVVPRPRSPARHFNASYISVSCATSLHGSRNPFHALTMQKAKPGTNGPLFIAPSTKSPKQHQSSKQLRQASTNSVNREKSSSKQAISFSIRYHKLCIGLQHWASFRRDRRPITSHL
jgi:hypothetical protein